MKPRTECACQSVAFMISARVAPPDRFSNSRIFAVLLPSRATPAFLTLAFFPPLGAFFAGLAFLAAFAFLGATWALRGATRRLLVRFRLGTRRCGLGGAGFFCSSRDHFEFSFGGDYRHDIDHSGALEMQGNSVSLADDNPGAQESAEAFSNNSQVSE